MRRSFRSSSGTAARRALPARRASLSFRSWSFSQSLRRRFCCRAFASARLCARRSSGVMLQSFLGRPGRSRFFFFFAAMPHNTRSASPEATRRPRALRARRAHRQAAHGRGPLAARPRQRRGDGADHSHVLGNGLPRAAARAAFARGSGVRKADQRVPCAARCVPRRAAARRHPDPHLQTQEKATW